MILGFRFCGLQPPVLAAAHPSIVYFFFFVRLHVLVSSLCLGLCLCLWVSEHKRAHACVCLRARRTEVATLLSVPLASDEAKACPLTHIHSRITSAAKPPLASKVEGRGRMRVDMNSSYAFK